MAGMERAAGLKAGRDVVTIGARRAARHSRAPQEHKSPMTPEPKRPDAAAKARRPVDAASVVATLMRVAKRSTLAGMARYGIPSDKALGVPVSTLHRMAKELGRDHALALALWETDVYEARMLCSFVDEPERVTPAQMERWCREFDSWAICDTLCFHLFDRTPHAFGKIREWARREEEFEKRAAFALLASVAAHDKDAKEADFARCLPLIERASVDERNFVKKGVLWALRMVGQRSVELNKASVTLARELAQSSSPSARWIGKTALREFEKPAMKRRLAKHARDAAADTKARARTRS